MNDETGHPINWRSIMLTACVVAIHMFLVVANLTANWTHVLRLGTGDIVRRDSVFGIVFRERVESEPFRELLRDANLPPVDVEVPVASGALMIGDRDGSSISRGFLTQCHLLRDILQFQDLSGDEIRVIWMEVVERASRRESIHDINERELANYEKTRSP